MDPEVVEAGSEHKRRRPHGAVDNQSSQDGPLELTAASYAGCEETRRDFRASLGSRSVTSQAPFR
jgi:hypothetical protein